MKKTLLIVFLIIYIMVFNLLFAQTTVSFIMQDEYFPVQFNDGGDFFNNGSTELGMWANTGSKNTAAWRTFKTAGDGTGSDRSLQVGDVLKITVAATRAYGQIGFSLNSGGTQGSNYINRISGSRLYFNTDNFAAWYVNRSGGNTSLIYEPIENTYKDYIFTVRITSNNTADVFLTVDGTDYRAYNLTMNGTGSIDAFSIYGSDLWDDSSNDNAYWKQACSVTNSKRVEVGYYLISGTFTPGLISDGLEANSTSTTSVNEVVIGGNSGSSVVFNQPNTYTGKTTVNTNAKLTIASGGTLGIGSDVYLSLNGALEVNTDVSVSSVRESGINNGGTASIADGVTLTINGADKGTFYQNSISGQGNLKLSGAGTTVLSLYGTQSYSGTTTIESSKLSTSVNLSSSLITVGNGATFDITENCSVNSLTLESGSVLNIASGKTLTINGILTIKGSYTISGGGTLAYGSSGVLKYEGSSITTTADDVFPASSGPKDLLITDASASGMTLHANRTLAGALTISAGEIFIIPATISLTVNGTLTNEAGNTGIVIKSDASGTGSLITANGVGATVERFLTKYDVVGDQMFHLISSPVAAQAIRPEFVSNAATIPAGTDFYSFSESTNEWINTRAAGDIWNTAFEPNFAVGKGYLVAYPSDVTKNFTGVLNSANVVLTCSNTAPPAGGNGWNLLGNPFPSAIDWDLVTKGTGMDNALYYYDNEEQQYRYYLPVAGDGTSLGSGSRYIPAMQGFMVHASTNNATLTIPTSSKTHEGQNIYYKSTATVPGSLSFKVATSSSYEDEAFIHFNSQATTAFDGSFDAYKLKSYSSDVPNLYTKGSDGSELAINGLPELSETTTIPVYLEYKTAGTYTFTADLSGISGTLVFLNDLKENTFVNLTQNPAYQFAVAEGDAAERFSLTFGSVGIEDPEQEPAALVYAVDKTIFIVGAEKDAQLILTDISGKMLKQVTASGESRVSISAASLPKGVYIVTVQGEGARVSRKVVL